MKNDPKFKTVYQVQVGMNWIEDQSFWQDIYSLWFNSSKRADNFNNVQEALEFIENISNDFENDLDMRMAH